MEVNKKIFISFVLASSIYFAFRSYSQGFPFHSSQADSQISLPTLKTVSSTLALAPLQIREPSLKSTSIAYTKQWNLWLELNPSIYYTKLNDRDYSLQDRRTIYFQESKQSGVDFILSGYLSIEDGQKIFTPQIYSQLDDQIYTEKGIVIHDMTIGSDLRTSLEFLLGMVERNSANNNKLIYLENPSLFLENWNVSPDTWERYIALIEKQVQKIPIEASEWEELAKRESNFWLPWEELILSRYTDKPESFDLRYLLETYPSRYSKQFNPILARLAHTFAEICLAKNNKYQASSFMEVASRYFLQSNKTYSIQYANFLSTEAKLFILDKDLRSAQLSLLNAQKIYQELGQTTNNNYIENQIELSKIYYQFGSLGMSFLEMEKSSMALKAKNQNNDSNDNYNLARASFNLGTLSLMMGKNKEALEYLENTIEILQKHNLNSTELMIFARTNLSACYLGLQNWNLAIFNSSQLLKDISIYELNGSEAESKNLYNLAVAYANKGGLETSKQYLDLYKRVTAYSKLVEFSESTSEFFPILTESLKLKSSFILDWEDKLIRSYTGKYRIDGQTQEIRSRTYLDRLEDHDIFMKNLLTQDGSNQEDMHQLKQILHISKDYASGKNVLFVDIGPALGNISQPAITSMSIIAKFPELDMVLIDLPSDVDFFMKQTDALARAKLLENQNIHIIQGDGTNTLKSWYSENSKSSWVLKDRIPPQTRNKLIIIRAANSIDIYESSSKVLPFLESLFLDYHQNDVIVLFNKSIFVKPKSWNKLQLFGSFASRGYYHNSQSLDRQGEPAYQLNSLPLRRRFSIYESN